MAPGGYIPEDYEEGSPHTVIYATNDVPRFDFSAQQKLERENEKLRREVQRLNREAIALRTRQHSRK